MHGYTLENADDPDAITLLCPTQHDEKTRGRLPLDRVLRANADPFNVKAGITSPYGLYYYGQEFIVGLGSNIATGIAEHDFTALLLYDEKVIAFRFSEGEIYLNAGLRDRAGEIVLQIVDNEMQHTTQTFSLN
jgi:hypothetical protein